MYLHFILFYCRSSITFRFALVALSIRWGFQLSFRSSSTPRSRTWGDSLTVFPLVRSEISSPALFSGEGNQFGFLTRERQFVGSPPFDYFVARYL